MFADDIIIFFQSTMDAVRNLGRALNVFATFAGQRINFKKSSLSLSPNTTQEMALFVSTAFNIKRSVFEGKYLGHNLDFSKSKREMFADLTSRIRRKIAGWKNAAISTTGRATLAKHVLCSLSQYVLGVFRIPILVAQSIDKCIARFIWRGEQEDRGIHWVSWDVMCQSKLHGGLGIRATKELNQAFFSKVGLEDSFGAQLFLLEILLAKVL